MEKGKSVYRLGKLISKYVILEILCYAEDRDLAFQRLFKTSKNQQAILIRNLKLAESIFKDQIIETMNFEFSRNYSMYWIASEHFLRKHKLDININDSEIDSICSEIA